MGAVNSGERGQWGSKIGFIFAAAGSAVGLGNIWRFPYMVGENGGAAFVLLYLACVFLIGLPLMYNELAFGRATGRNPIGAFKESGNKGGVFIFAGILSLLVCFFVLSYYGVIAGWTIGYTWFSLTGKLSHVTSPEASGTFFADFVKDPMTVIGLLGAFIVLTIIIVQAGVEKGIETASKILMPVLFILISAVIVRSLTLEGAMEGVKYYLNPDFSKITGRTFLAALGQAFFSMSVGWGLMITYGSYMDKQSNLFQSGFWVAIADTLVALAAGFMVFPAVFAAGLQPDAGPALTFVTLPIVFNTMPAGWLVGAIFFLLLTVAAVTSSISMLEVPVSYFVDEKKMARKIAAWGVGIGAFVVGIPSALSQGGSELFSSFPLFGGMPFLDFLDKWFGTFSVVLISLLLSVYVGWFWGAKNAEKEIAQGAPIFERHMAFGFTFGQGWSFLIKFVCPIVIIIMLVFQVSE